MGVMRDPAWIGDLPFISAGPIPKTFPSPSARWRCPMTCASCSSARCAPCSVSVMHTMLPALIHEQPGICVAALARLQNVHVRGSAPVGARPGHLCSPARAAAMRWPPPCSRCPRWARHELPRSRHCRRKDAVKPATEREARAIYLGGMAHLSCLAPAPCCWCRDWSSCYSCRNCPWRGIRRRSRTINSVPASARTAPAGSTRRVPRRVPWRQNMPSADWPGAPCRPSPRPAVLP